MSRAETCLDGLSVGLVFLVLFLLFLFLFHEVGYRPMHVGDGLRVYRMYIKEAGTTRSQHGLRIEIVNE